MQIASERVGRPEPLAAPFLLCGMPVHPRICPVRAFGDPGLPQPIATAVPDADVHQAFVNFADNMLKTRA